MRELDGESLCSRALIACADNNPCGGDNCNTASALAIVTACRQHTAIAQATQPEVKATQLATICTRGVFSWIVARASIVSVTGVPSRLDATVTKDEEHYRDVVLRAWPRRRKVHAHMRTQSMRECRWPWTLA